MGKVDAEAIVAPTVFMIVGAISLGMGTFYPEWSLVFTEFPDGWYAVTLGVWLACAVIGGLALYLEPDEEREESTTFDKVGGFVFLLGIALYPLGAVPGISAKMTATWSYALTMPLFVLVILWAAWDIRKEAREAAESGGAA